MQTSRPQLGLYCPGDGSGGPWQYVHSILQGLDLAEFDVTLFCDLPGSYERRDGIGVVRLGGSGSHEAASDNAALSAATRKPQGEQHSRTFCRRLVRCLPASARLCAGFLRDASRLARLLRRYPVDLLHTQSTGCEESPLAARWAGVPRVLGTFHVDSTVDVGRLRDDRTHRLLEWVSNRCLDQAIAVSEAARRDWIDRSGIAPDRVATIHNGIDPSRYCRRQTKEEARGQLGLPYEAMILAGVGRLEPAKGFADLIDAVADLRQDFPQVLAVIAGSGRLAEPLKSRAEALGVCEAVRFLGYQSDVNPLLDAADVFVIPSLSETLGYALLEAMAHELPAVGTTVGGIPEVVAAGVTGFLAPARNPPALAAAIGPLLASAELRQRLGSAARKRVVQNFHEADMVRKTLDFYRAMLASCRLTAAAGRPLLKPIVG